MEEFKTPYGVELLASVYWTVAEEASRSVRNWTARKGDLFNDRHVRIAWERLREEGWLPEGVAPA